MTLEIVSKRYSSGYLPVVGSYVEFEVRLTNGASFALENQSMRVSLVSEGNRTHSSAEYSVAHLEPGESKTFHIGPFKMEEEGEHRLLAGFDSITLGYKLDSFAVYRPEAVQASFIAISMIAAGSGMVGFFLYRKRKIA
jgi:hypothetical protein